MNKIKFCKICGRETNKPLFGMCKKHYLQYIKYGKVLDNNPRTVFDNNEIRIYDDYAEIDTYDNQGNLFKTYKLDIEDVPILNNHKWRTIIKKRKTNGIIKKTYYLGTGHSIYFHRLITGNPNCEVDHINKDTLDNRKNNLSFKSNSDNRINTNMRTNNTTQIKGVCYNKKTKEYHVEFGYLNKRYYSKHFKIIEEAVYMRYLYEQHFIPQYSINNTKLVNEMIQKLDDKKKKDIQKYFSNRYNNQEIK